MACLAYESVVKSGSIRDTCAWLHYDIVAYHAITDKDICRLLRPESTLHKPQSPAYLAVIANDYIGQLTASCQRDVATDGGATWMREVNLLAYVLSQQ